MFHFDVQGQLVKSTHAGIVRYLVAADIEMVVGEGATWFTVSYRLTWTKVENGVRKSWLRAPDLNLQVDRHNQ